MKKGKEIGLTRRQLAKAAGGALAAAAFPFSCARGPAKKKTLRIIQWSHYIPAYDHWFDDAWTKAWGMKNGTDVLVDHMSATEVPTRGAAEAAAGKGHDLFHFLSPPAAYERHAIDHAEIVREVGGRKIKERFGCPVGIGFSQEMDSNMALRALLWSFGGAEQDESGRPRLDSNETVAALKFGRALYKETQAPDVFTWDPSSNNRAMLSGRSSFVQNAISVTRTAEKENPKIASKIGLTPALAGPTRRIAAEHLMSCYVIWKFAENPEAAKQFLVDLVDAFGSVFRESAFYSFPCYPATVPDLAGQLARDPQADPPGKYAVLATALDWATNVGFPGYASAPIDEVFNTFVIPTMFARAARDEATPEEAAKAADREVRRIFAKWQSTRS
jgi:multiple sugar transport system substrate-binding protein